MEQQMNSQDVGKALNKVIGRAWADDAFKARLLADPAATLAAEGLTPPAGLTVKVVENTDTVFNLVLPPKPQDLSDAELDQMAGGFCSNCCTPVYVSNSSPPDTTTPRGF